MLPTIEEAKKELLIAGEMNPGPWVGQSLNVGIAARNIADIGKTTLLCPPPWKPVVKSE